MTDNFKLFQDFKNIINEKNFDIKLDEQTFDSYINHSKETKNKITNFLSSYEKIKSTYNEFATKGTITIPDKKNNKSKNKKKKKREDQLNRESDYSDYSNLSPTLSHTDSMTDSKIMRDSLRQEVDYLKSRIDNIKLKFTFDSMENVAKNLHLFDEYFMKIKMEQQKTEQLNMINMFKSKASLPGDNVANFFNAYQNNDGVDYNRREQKPECFQYFEELNQRWAEFGRFEE